MILAADHLFLEQAVFHRDGWDPSGGWKQWRGSLLRRRAEDILVPVQIMLEDRGFSWKQGWIRFGAVPAICPQKLVSFNRKAVVFTPSKQQQAAGQNSNGNRNQLQPNMESLTVFVAAAPSSTCQGRPWMRHRPKGSDDYSLIDSRKSASLNLERDSLSWEKACIICRDATLPGAAWRRL